MAKAKILTPEEEETKKVKQAAAAKARAAAQAKREAAKEMESEVVEEEIHEITEEDIVKAQIKAREEIRATEVKPVEVKPEVVEIPETIDENTYRLVELPGGKYQLRHYFTDDRFRVVKEGSREKCEAYRIQLLS